MSEQDNKRRGGRLGNANLWRNPKTGVYYWRRVHKVTGKRFRRSTGTKNLRLALRRIQEFEEEHEREAAGLTNYGDYRRPLVDFVEPFLASLTVSEDRTKLLRPQLFRAFRLLRLDCLADLDNFVGIERRLLALRGEGPGKFRQKTLARCFQDPLKQFSKYLAGRREMESDPLAGWPHLKTDPPERRRRAIMPDELARVLAASDCLDAMFSREHPMRIVWTTLLIAAPRVSALAALNVEDLDYEGHRLLLAGNHRKRAGAGALDEKTLSEILAYLDDRNEGPLFLSPCGKRIKTDRSLDQWRAAASLAFVDLEWPEGEPRDLWTAYLVQHALMTGHVRVSLGGPKSGPNRPGPRKWAERRKRAAQLESIADATRGGWEERMKGIDQHCLRMTHRTWALTAGVPEILVDRQLGHTSPAGEAALRAAWSAVGRAHYTDMNFLALDARRSADAVREMLDRAEADFKDVVERGETLLGTAERRSGATAVGEALSKTASL